MIKLDIGSGGKAASYLGDGWIGVDPFVDEADIKAEMWNLPYEDESVDEIFTSHALEHIAKKDILPTLKEWHRILKPDGKITVRVPNLEWCVRHWLEHKDSLGWELDIIFGNQNHLGEFHKTGFTSYTLFQYLWFAGFNPTRHEILHTHGQETISVEAVKL